MAFLVLDESERALDAFLELQEDGIDFHSRGGSKKIGNHRNSEYSPALRLILQRLRSAKIEIEGIWLNSSNVQSMSIDQRWLLSNKELQSDSALAFTRVSERMKTIGQSQNAKGGNSTRRIRIQFKAFHKLNSIQDQLCLQHVPQDLRNLHRLPNSELWKVRPDHIWDAISALRQGAQHNFGPSTDFDVIVNESERYPPKAVFGLAATQALGFDVGPKHFSGGKGTVCFKSIEKAGYGIVAKGENYKDPEIPTNEDDRIWLEGSPKFIGHFRKERAKGLAAAKKSQFINLHGRLFCEKCKMDPIQVFGDENGLACIEVHHRTTAVSEMDPDHQTKLEDLQCLCANCHRVVHHLMNSRGIQS